MHNQIHSWPTSPLYYAKVAASLVVAVPLLALALWCFSALADKWIDQNSVQTCEAARVIRNHPARAICQPYFKTGDVTYLRENFQ